MSNQPVNRSVYGDMFGMNPNAARLLLMSGLEFSDFPSLIDVNLATDGREIVVFCSEDDAKERALEELTDTMESLDNPRVYTTYVFDVPQKAHRVCESVWESLDEHGRMGFEDRLEMALEQLVTATQEERQEKYQEAADSRIAEAAANPKCEEAAPQGRVIANPKHHVIPEGHLSDLNDKMIKAKEAKVMKELRDSIS
jgi:hypothetical protein